MHSSIHRDEDGKTGRTVGWSIDARIEADDTLEIRTYPSASGFNLAIDLDGRTIIRIGGFRTRPEITHE